MGSMPDCKYKDICYKNNNFPKNCEIVPFSNRIDNKDLDTNEDNKNFIIFIDPYKPNNNYFYKVQNVIKIQRAYRKYILSQKNYINNKIRKIFSIFPSKDEYKKNNKENEKNDKDNSDNSVETNNNIKNNNEQNNSKIKNNQLTKTQILKKTDTNTFGLLSKKTKKNNVKHITFIDGDKEILNKINKSKIVKINKNNNQKKTSSSKVKKNFSLTNEHTLKKNVNLASLKRGSIKLNHPIEPTFSVGDNGDNKIKTIKSENNANFVKSLSDSSSNSNSNSSSNSSSFNSSSNSFTSSNSSSSSSSSEPSHHLKTTIYANNRSHNSFSSFFSSEKELTKLSPKKINSPQNILFHFVGVENDIFGYFLKKTNKKFNIKIDSCNIIDNKKNGFGIVTWEDNSKLYGEFKENKLYGICKFYNSQNNCIFKGEYENNIPYGYGIYEMMNGSYEGIWVRNNLIGIGIEIWNDQTFFQGEYSKSKRNGIGLYRWPDGTIYQGQWVNNQMQGYGTIIYSDDRIYSGEVYNGLMHGVGIFSWRNGYKYIGNYYKDLKSGFGTFIWSNKPLLAFVGFWQKGKQNGVGASINGSAVKYGFWKDGKNEFYLKGSWELRKYMKPSQYVYEKILARNAINYIKAINVN